MFSVVPNILSFCQVVHYLSLNYYYFLHFGNEISSCLCIFFRLTSFLHLVETVSCTLFSLELFASA